MAKLSQSCDSGFAPSRRLRESSKNLSSLNRDGLSPFCDIFVTRPPLSFSARLLKCAGILKNKTKSRQCPDWSRKTKRTLSIIK